MTLKVSSPLNFVPWAPHLSHPSLGLVNCFSMEISFKMSGQGCNRLIAQGLTGAAGSLSQ